MIIPAFLLCLHGGMWGQPIQACTSLTPCCLCDVRLQKKIHRVRFFYQSSQVTGTCWVGLQVKHYAKENVRRCCTTPRCELCGSDIVFLGADRRLQLKDLAESASLVHSLGPGCSALFRCDEATSPILLCMHATAAPLSNLSLAVSHFYPMQSGQYI